MQISLLEKANLAPAEVDFIEAHGTGTSLGDLIEIEGINEVFQSLRFLSGCGCVPLPFNLLHQLCWPRTLPIPRLNFIRQNTASIASHNATFHHTTLLPQSHCWPRDGNELRQFFFVILVKL